MKAKCCELANSIGQYFAMVPERTAVTILSRGEHVVLPKDAKLKGILIASEALIKLATHGNLRDRHLWGAEVWSDRSHDKNNEETLYQETCTKGEYDQSGNVRHTGIDGYVFVVYETSGKVSANGFPLVRTCQ